VPEYHIYFGLLEAEPVHRMVEALGRTVNVSFAKERTPGAYSGGNDLYHLNLDTEDPEFDQFDADHPYAMEIKPRHPEHLRVATDVFRLMRDAGRYRVVLLANSRTVDATHYPLDED
jgi:hypothetical protein